MFSSLTCVIHGDDSDQVQKSEAGHHEDLPKYPGGAVEFMKWLTRNLQYPASARSRKIQGKVVAVFYVEKDGHVTGISITKSLSPECDREALRVLRKMPNWEPGIQNDQPCRTKVSIPIVFKL